MKIQELIDLLTEFDNEATVYVTTTADDETRYGVSGLVYELAELETENGPAKTLEIRGA